MNRSISHRWFKVAAIAGIVFCSRSVLGQKVVVDSDAEAQTDKSPSFSVRKEQQPIINAFEDFERYRDKKAWEKAFGALGKIDESKPGRLVPDKDGFLIPTELKVRAELLSLPPDGRQAYRLFNDAKAAQLLKAATEANENDIPALSKIVNRYFVTSIGDQAADHLGDALFETGDFANADRCWRLILDNYPDSSLSPVLLQTKRAIALSRSAGWDQFDIVRATLHDRYAGQTAHIGGSDIVATELVDSLRSDVIPASSAPTVLSNTPPELPTSDRPIWQVPLMDAQAAAQLVAQLGNNGWGSMAGNFTSALPATAVDDKRIYINWLGICFAADMRTGKLLWRTDTFGDMTQKMAQSMMYGTTIDPQIYTVTRAGDNVLFTRRSTENQNYNELPMNRLLCLKSETGKSVWKSENGPLSGWGVIGQPLIDGDQFYIIAHPPASQELSLLCVGLAKADLKWKAIIGTPASSTNYRGQPSIPQPALLLRTGKLQVLTNNGALVQVDCGTHQVDWSFSYPTYVQQQQPYYGYYIPSPVIAPGAMLSVGPTLYFKEFNGNLLFALDTAEPALRWKRRIDSENGITHFDGRNFYLVGTEIECLDNDSRTLQWDEKTSIRTGTIQPLVQADWLYVFGSRGVTSTRLSNGQSGPVFRGFDRDSDGGILWKTSTRLVTVSSRAITAYAMGHAN